MASTRKRTTKDGRSYYKVTASCGRGRRITRSWYPQETWSERTIQKELNKFAADLENQLSSGDLLTRSEQEEAKRQAAIEAAKIKTMRQYCDGVYMPIQSLHFSENTRANYQIVIDKHILPVLGDFPIKDIIPAMVEKLLVDFQGTHAISSCVKVYTVLCGIFKAARKDKSVEHNIMLDVDRPRLSKDDEVEPENEQERAYTAQELAYILRCLENEPLRWRLYITLLADTGLRRGEAVGLKWECVDLQSEIITVKYNAQYTPKKGVYITSTKSSKIRRVDIGADVVKLLQQWRQEQSTSGISSYVFNQEGSPDVMHPQTPTRYFERFARRYNITDFHPHKLRHTSASIAVTNGADVVSVAKRLGHSDPALTLRWYSHANDETMRRAGDVVREQVKLKQA